MMERRLGSEDDSNCVIANLKAQVGQLEKALKDALEMRAGAKVGQEEVKEWLHEVVNRKRGADLDSSHQLSEDAPGADLDTSHESSKSSRDGEENIDPEV